MSDTIEATTCEVVVERKPSFVQAVFGQLKDPTFWVDLFKTMASEAFKAFVLALGGELMRYGSSSRAALPVPPMGSPVAQRAFGSAYTPTPSYQPGSSYPVPVSQPTGDTRFPGFGSPR